jgi:hypothetical protein
VKLLPPVSKSTTAEVKLRLERIRNQLEKAAGAAAAEGSRVTLQGEFPLSAALAALAQQTGNRFLDLREKFGQEPRDPKVKAQFDRALFWEALDRLLDQAGLTLYHFGGQEGTLGIVARRDGDVTRAERASYSGLFRFEGLRMQAVRDLRNPRNDGLRLMLEVAWEPRVAPILLQLPLAELQATDEAGGAIGIDSPKAKLEVPVENAIPTAELTVPLNLPARGVTKIAALSGTLSALLPGQVETFEFTDLEAGKTVEQRRAGVTVVLEQVRKNGEVYELRLRVRFEKANDALESHRGWIDSNEAYLVDAEGKRFDRANLEASRSAPNEAVVTYLFDPDQGLKGCKLVYRTPAVLVRLPVRFTLKDISLP